MGRHQDGHDHDQREQYRQLKVGAAISKTSDAGVMLTWGTEQGIVSPADAASCAVNMLTAAVVAIAGAEIRDYFTQRAPHDQPQADTDERAAELIGRISARVTELADGPAYLSGPPFAGGPN